MAQTTTRSPVTPSPVRRASTLVIRLAITVTLGSDMAPFIGPWLAYGSNLLGMRKLAVSPRE